MIKMPNDRGDAPVDLAVERTRLVRLCAQITGNSQVAEDLAQETLSEAWRHRSKLRDPAGSAAWLSAIARHVCRHWARRYGRDRAHVLPSGDDHEHPSLSQDALVAGDDLEGELERAELVALLDRALARLPPTTRRVLVERYSAESPHAEIAARLGMTEGAVKVSLHRGKRALRRVLLSEFSQEAAAYGLSRADGDDGQETRIWCPYCGQGRLVAVSATSPPDLTLRCPICCSAPDDTFAHVTGELLHGVKGYKPALSRVLAWTDTYYRRGLATQRVACVSCSRSMPLQIGLPEGVPLLRWDRQGIHVRCGHCHATYGQGPTALALALPQGQQFWRVHPRIRALPDRLVEAAGCAARVTSFESVTGPARLDVLSTYDTFAVLAVHTTSAQRQEG